MKFEPGAAALVLLSVLAGDPASAQSTVRVSLATGGTQGNGGCSHPAISADGRFVAFQSSASNLVPGDTNQDEDIFVYDRQTGTTERVSVDSFGVEATWFSEWAAISADGRFVAFSSPATNLVANDTNSTDDIFVRDRVAGTTERVSLSSAGAQGNFTSVYPSLSADGRFVAFTSGASTLVAGDTNGWADVFVRDRQNGTTARVSLSTAGVQANDNCNVAAISGDGRFVAFMSYASNLAAGDTNGCLDIFVRDRQLGTTERVSVDSGGLQANLESAWPSISFDGRYVAFFSLANNLVAGDTNGFYDVFVRDRLSGTTECASASTVGLPADASSLDPSISAEGRYVAFMSYASNLILGYTSLAPDIFVRDRQNGTTVLASASSGGTAGNLDCDEPSITADGRFVAFWSNASNLVAGDTNGAPDIFVRDRGIPPPAGFCFGDGGSGACPCGNLGLFGGCENSASTGGAMLTSAGSSSLWNDTLVLTASGELPSVLSIFLQGSASIAPSNFGDGLRCTGGLLKRLYIHNASAGSVSGPQGNDLSISARSAALGDVLAPGSTRYYQTYYRDPVLGFCPSPAGNSWNISSGLVVLWAQ